MITNQRDTIISLLNSKGFPLADDAIKKFEHFEYLIRKANKNLRLLAREEENRLWQRHFLDSIIPLVEDIISPNGRLLDIGSGAGLPGIPLAICASELSVTMLESVAKKARFIERTIAELQLCNARIINKSAENFSEQPSFDTVVVRSVGKIRELLPLTQRNLISGGRVIFYKGRKPEDELSEIQSFSDYGFISAEIHRLPTELSPDGFTIVFLEKL